MYINNVEERNVDFFVKKQVMSMGITRDLYAC